MDTNFQPYAPRAKDDSQILRSPISDTRRRLPFAREYAHWGMRLVESDAMNPQELILRMEVLSDIGQCSKERRTLAQEYQRDLLVRTLLPAPGEDAASIFVTDTGKYLYINHKLYFVSGYSSVDVPRYEEIDLSLATASQKGVKILVLRSADGVHLPLRGADLIPLKDVMTETGTTVLFVGHGGETDPEVPKLLHREGFCVIPLKIVTREFLHLDTFFCPLPKGCCLFYKGTAAEPTVDPESMALLDRLYPGDKKIELTKEETEHFAANCVVYKNKTGEWVIMAPANAFLATTREKLILLGFIIKEIDYSAVQDRNGSIRCTTLESFIPEFGKKRSKSTDDLESKQLRTELESRKISLIEMIIEENEDNSKTIYRGLTRKGKPHKYGVFNSDKEVYEGMWKHGMHHGKGKLFYKDGEYKGCYKDGIWIDDVFVKGVVRIHNGSGDIYEGEADGGYCMEFTPQGKGRATFADGRIYDGELRKGSYHGKGKLSFRNGDFFDGIWENHSFMEGKMRLTYDNGNIYEGESLHKKPYGRGKMIYANGTIFEGIWENGIPKD
ncbi:MAG: hypothetical protein WC860_02290 [Candidatus Margulisiibacteriota bacterium]|jgi:hypothetical protein